MSGIKNQEKILLNGMNTLIGKADQLTKNCPLMLKLLDLFTEMQILATLMQEVTCTRWV